MTTFVREDVDALNVVLTCTIPAADYAPKVKNLLRKIQQTAQIKGFRPGKVPQVMIDKMYEKGAIHDEVVKVLDEELNKYLQEANIRYLGQPLPAGDNFQPFSLKANVDFEFKYEIGLFPTFEIKGADTSFNVTRYEVDVTDEMLDKEVETLRKRYGQRGDVDTATAESMLTVRLVELDETNAPKEGGVVKEDAKLVMDKLSDAARNLLVGKSVADTMQVNVYELEADMTEERVKTWILGAEKDAEVNANFDLTVLEVKDMVPATLDDAFFEKVFGEEREINTESELRAEFTKIIKRDFDGVATQMVLNQVYDNLLVVNKFDIPEAFMRNWLKFNDAKMTDEKLDTDWDNICKDIRWSIMKSELTQQAQVQITKEEMYGSFYAEVQRYFGNYGGGEEMIHGIVERMMKNEEAVEKRFQEMLSERILLYVANKVDTTTEIISKERFEAILEENNKKGQVAEALEA
jgi:trigger factor